MPAIAVLTTSGCYIPGGGWTLRTGVDVRTLTKPAAFVEMVDTRWDEWNRVAIKNATQKPRGSRGGEVITVTTPVIMPAPQPTERLIPQPEIYDRGMPENVRPDTRPGAVVPDTPPSSPPERINSPQEPNPAPGATEPAPPAPERPRDAGPSARLTSRSPGGFGNGPSLSTLPPLSPSDVEHQTSAQVMPQMVTPSEETLSEPSVDEVEPVKEKSGLNLSGFQLFNGKWGNRVQQSSSDEAADSAAAKAKRHAQRSWFFGKPSSS